MTPAILGVLLVVSAAAPTDDPWVLAVGVNESGEADLAPLAYADDDAVAVIELLQGAADRRILHTTMDAATQMRVPYLAAEARVPTRLGLLESVQEMSRAMKRPA